MNFNLIYDTRCPKELKNILDPLFHQFNFIVPQWVEDVYVFFDDDQDPDFAVAETITTLEYRRVFLKFYPDFIFERDDKVYQFVHELCHAVYGSAATYAFKVISTVVTDNPLLKDILLEQLRMINEGSTQDMTNMIFKLLSLDKRTGKKIKRKQ